MDALLSGSPFDAGYSSLKYPMAKPWLHQGPGKNWHSAIKSALVLSSTTCNFEDDGSVNTRDTPLYLQTVNQALKL